MFCNLGGLQWQWSRIWRKSRDSFVAGPISPEQCWGLHKKCFPPYRPWNAVALPQTICTGSQVQSAECLPDFHQNGDIGIVFTRAGLQFELSLCTTWSSFIQSQWSSARAVATNQQSEYLLYWDSPKSPSWRVWQIFYWRKINIDKIMTAAVKSAEMKRHWKSFSSTFSCDWWPLVVTLVTY